MNVRRHSIRLPAYDYAQAGAYFITIVTHDRSCLFGRVENDAIALNDVGRAVQSEWSAMALHRDHIELDAFVVMPNHVHGIIWLLDHPNTSRPASRERPSRAFGKMDARSLPAVVRGFKSAATRHVNIVRDAPGTPLWQKNYYERVLRGDRELHDVRKYISENPLRWALDAENPDA